MVGQTILQYQILEKLGAGGMGEIYKAQDTRLNRLVAIKVLLGGNSTDPEFRRRFIQEAQAASSLNHPNIITIYDIVPRGKDQFMVMEYIDGKTLSALIPPGGLDVPQTLQYAVQIADGLDAAHAACIVHRDLKPGNIMVSAHRRVKILDFGLAKLTAPVSEVSLSDITQSVGPAPMTLQGVIVGSVSYMSPEQAQGANVDARSDIFSFGCVLYEMITGRKAFQADAPLLTLAAILRDEPQPIPELVTGVPPELVQIVHRALRKDPGQRFQSMQEMLAELMALKLKSDSGVLSFAPVPPAEPVTRQPSLRSGRALAAVAIAFLVLASGLVWWWTSRGASRIPAAPVQPAAQDSATASSKPSALSPAILNNQAILDMTQAKVPESVILGQIRSSATNFNLSTAEIIRLTKGGVTEAVIHAMRNPAAAGPVPEADSPPAPTGRTVQVVSGLPFEIELTEDVPPDCQPGQVLNFRTAKGVTVGDALVIAKGASVTGVVVSGARKKFLVHTTRPTFRLLEATAVGGTRVRVRASESRKNAPLDPLGGSRSKEAIATAGSRFLAYFDGDQTVTLPK